MADKKCGLRYCAATVYDYNEAIYVLKCRCMKCFGDKCETCDMYKKSQEMGIDLQQQMQQM